MPRTDLGAKFDAGVTALNAAVVVLNAKIDTGLAEVRGELAELRGELKLGLAKQTYIILAGVAAFVAPIYIALFAGFGG